MYLHVSRNETKAAMKTLPPLPCGCATLRRAARAVTQLYDEALRPLDMRITEFTILQVLDRVGTITHGTMAEVLAMDSTTLSRTLKLVERGGGIAAVPGKDRRERHYQITRKGKKQLERALPAWEEVQRRLQKAMGPAGWAQLVAASDQAAGAAARL
jgi:DNA-binding MarR family transcriptional regulator